LFFLIHDEISLIETYFTDVCLLVALLSGARNEENLHLSEKIYNRMKTLFPERTDPLISAAILLANGYASSDENETANNIRRQLHTSGLTKKIGLAWTVVNGRVYVRKKSFSKSIKIIFLDSFFPAISSS
jgi:hypothetical protein